MINLKNLFSIKNTKPEGQAMLCLIDVGDTVIGGVLLSQNKKQVYAASYIELEHTLDWQAPFQQLKANLDLASFSNIQFEVVYNNTAVTLIPSMLEVGDMTSDMLNLMYGLSPYSTLMNQQIHEINAQVIWRIETSLLTSLQKITGNNIHHRHAFQQVCKEIISDKSLHCTFYPGCLRVKLAVPTQLLFVGYFNYQTHNDVLYFLLDLCTKYQIDPTEIHCRLDGFISEDSILYKEIAQYFGHVEMNHTSELAESEILFDPYPIHYFTPIIPFITCA